MRGISDFKASRVAVPKRQFFFNFFTIFSAALPYIRPLAGPNIAKRAGRYWQKLNFQAVIKSAASAASLDSQGSPRTMARHADGGARRLSCKSRETALAADLISAGKFF